MKKTFKIILIIIINILFLFLLLFISDVITYKYATGLEALIGYLYYKNKLKRIDELMYYVINN